MTLLGVLSSNPSVSLRNGGPLPAKHHTPLAAVADGAPVMNGKSLWLLFLLNPYFISSSRERTEKGISAPRTLARLLLPGRGVLTIGVRPWDLRHGSLKAEKPAVALGLSRSPPGPFQVQGQEKLGLGEREAA